MNHIREATKMVSQKYVDKQLKNIGFNPHGWGRGEIRELPNIILPDEEIYECVNGIYEGGFALLIATDIRVLLVDQKPMNYLTIEDMRFDMISEMDYSHRLLGARISISAGDKNLKFRSYNQPRLRKLIGHVQHCMAEAKKTQSNHGEGQLQHLEKLNEQLQKYMLTQQQHQNLLQQQLNQVTNGQASNIQVPDPVKPDPELSDYLFAQSLLAQHNHQPEVEQSPPPLLAEPAGPASEQVRMKELYDAGIEEVFGKHQIESNENGVHPMQIAYSKLPMALKNRKFGHPQPQPKVLKHV